jgi:hypothetical protein
LFDDTFKGFYEVIIMDTNSVLLVAGICMVIGFLFGGMVRGLRKGPESGPSDDHEDTGLKVRTGAPGSNLIVEFEGVEYKRSSNLTPAQRNQINQIILKMNAWLTYDPTQKQEKTTPTTTYPSSLDTDDLEKSKPRFSLNPVNVLTNALKADVPLSQLPTESIVSQIDDILQGKLRNSSLSGEPIRLMEWPNKGMVVMVGLDQYDSVDEVPNEEIKKLIRSAVSEWEQRGIENT